MYVRTGPQFGSVAGFTAAAAAAADNGVPPVIGLGLIGAGVGMHYYKKYHHQQQQVLPQALPFQTSPSQDVWSPIVQRSPSVQFGSDNDGIDWENAAVGAGVSFATKYLKAPETKYRKITDKYSAPSQTAEGKALLRRARTATKPEDKSDYLSQAESKFSDAAVSARTNTHEAEARRLAGIAGKLQGRSQAVVSEDSSFSVQRRRAGKSDADQCLKEGLDVSTHVTTVGKGFALFPLAALEIVGNQAIRTFAGREPRRPMGITDTVMEKISPYSTHVERKANEIKRKNAELAEGESSDEDWMNDKPRAKSKRKGLRHEFI